MVNCYPCKVCACGWFVTDTSQAGVCRRCGHDEGQHEDVSCIKSTKPAPHSCIEFIYNGYCMKCNGKYKDLRIYLEIIDHTDNTCKIIWCIINLKWLLFFRSKIQIARGAEERISGIMQETNKNEITERISHYLLFI